MATAGVTIVSAAAAEEDIPAEVVPQPIAGVTEARRQRAETTEPHPRPTQGLPQPLLTLHRRAPADRSQQRIPQQHTALTPAHPAVEDPTATDINNR
jgi:hypothetical protein